MLTRILISDDHPAVRQGLKHILAERFQQVRFGEARNERETLELVRTKKWDVILLDITLGGRSGLEILNHLKTKLAKLPVIIYTMHPEEQYALRALKAGAAGYVTKDTDAEELCVAVAKVLAGGRYITSSIAERLTFYLNAPPSARLPHETLSDREYQVFRLLASGKTVTHIAKQLCLSIKTISTHRARILKKLHIGTTAELVRYAIQNNLVE